MFCEKCGNQLPNGAKFCGKCGAAVIPMEGQAVQKPATPLPDGAGMPGKEKKAKTKTGTKGKIPKWAIGGVAVFAVIGIVIGVRRWRWQTADYHYGINMDANTALIVRNARSNATNVVIPEKIRGRQVTIIASEAFYDCDSLESISIPEGVTIIGDRAFYDCDSLESISIPEGVTSIGGYIFAHCDSLESISIPEGVTSIGEGAFQWCSSLESVSLPGSLTSIARNAFSDCSSLKSISIPEGVMSIGQRAFANCDGGLSIILPASLTEIGSGAFPLGATIYVQPGSYAEQWVRENWRGEYYVM